MPSGLVVEMEALGETHIKRELLRIGERAAGSVEGAALWMSLFEDVLLIEKVQFLTEGAHGEHGHWEQDTEATLAAKKRAGEQEWIERASEALFNSLTEKGGEGQIHEQTSSWMRFGSDIGYAGFQQTGTTNMPRRRLIDFTELERVAIVKKVQRFIMTGEIWSLA